MLGHLNAAGWTVAATRAGNRPWRTTSAPRTADASSSNRKSSRMAPAPAVRQLQRQHRRRAGPGGVRWRDEPAKASASHAHLSRAGPRHPRLCRDRCAGGRRRPGRERGGHRRRPPRRRRAAGRALQPPGRPFHRRSRHLDRPHVGLVRPARHPRHRQRADGAAAQGRHPGTQPSRLGLQGRGDGGLLGAAHRRLPRHRHVVADHRPRSAQDTVDADGGRGQGAPAAACLGGRADPRGERRQGRHFRKQGRPPRRLRQGGDRYHG